jgi:hypothetical protein
MATKNRFYRYSRREAGFYNGEWQILRFQIAWQSSMYKMVPSDTFPGYPAYRSKNVCIYLPRVELPPGLQIWHGNTFRALFFNTYQPAFLKDPDLL